MPKVSAMSSIVHRLGPSVAWRAKRCAFDDRVVPGVDGERDVLGGARDRGGRVDGGCGGGHEGLRGVRVTRRPGAGWASPTVPTPKASCRARPGGRASPSGRWATGDGGVNRQAWPRGTRGLTPTAWWPNTAPGPQGRQRHPPERWSRHPPVSRSAHRRPGVAPEITPDPARTWSGLPADRVAGRPDPVVSVAVGSVRERGGGPLVGCPAGGDQRVEVVTALAARR